MADPLSITLAAITLATALKDIVALAQKIEGSFKQVSRNTRELRALASEIKMTALQLMDFSDEHPDILCDSSEMKLALLGLMSDMGNFYDRCRNMFPPAPATRAEKFKVAINAWLNRNKIESEIRELRNRVNKCHSQFMMFAIMRIENHVVVIRQKGHKGAHEFRKEITTGSASDDRLIAFMGSNGRTLSKLPPEITADFISDTYLCLQIVAIDEMLHRLSSNSYPVEEPLEEYLLPYQPVVPSNVSYDKKTIRQEIILQSLEIQSYLRSDSGTLSIQAGAWTMVNLCIGLHTLKMYHEALTTGLWTVNLFRTLARQNPNIYLPYLVHSLRTVSRFYLKVDDVDGSLAAIEEATQISRNLQVSATNIEINFQFGNALATLAYTLRLKGNNEESLKAAEESVNIYAEAIGSAREVNNGMDVGQFESDWGRVFEGISHKAMTDYSRALEQLSYSLEANGRLEDAFHTAKNALGVLIYSTNLFVDESVEVEIASLLYRISHQDFRKFLSIDEALTLSEESVSIYRVHCSKDIEQHGSSLCNALWEQAHILGELERYDEALATWKETVELAESVLADQIFRADALNQLSWSLRKLKRHDEAANTRTESVLVYSGIKSMTEKEAHAQFDLGVDLRLAGRFSEAIRSLQSALTQYRALSFRNPDIYSQNIGRTLNQLTLNYVYSKQFNQAFNEGHESLKLHACLLDEDPNVLSEYIFAIRLNSLISDVAEDEGKCVERARYTLDCARSIARLHPTEGNLLFLQATLGLAVVLCRFERVLEAETVIREALGWHERNPSDNPKDVEQYMHCLITITAIVYNQGYVQKALQHLQTSIEIGKSYSSHKPVASTLVSSMHRRVQVLCTIGLYSEAVHASQECVDFARQIDMEGVADFIGCLHVAATAFKYCGRIDEALKYIEEGLELSRGEKMIEMSKDRPSVLLLESESLELLSTILSEAGREDDALAIAKLAVDSALGLKSKHATLPWSEIEPNYMDALHTLSLRLAANDDLAGALDLISQVRVYYDKRTASRNGDSLTLARVLCTEGTLLCASGRRDDGSATIAKLHDLQNRLRVVHPELSRNVEICLEKHRTLSSSVALMRKFDLKCGHQH